MSSLQLMMDAGNRLPEHVMLWTQWMQMVLILAPFAFIRFRGARWLVLAQVANFVVAYFVFVAEGHQVTRLFGLGHVFWLAPLWMLAVDTRSGESAADEPSGQRADRRPWLRGYRNVYRVYAAVAAATILVSLVFDARDFALWVSGDRGSVLEPGRQDSSG